MSSPGERLIKNNLERYLEMWARWVRSGQITRSTSILQMIMEGGSFSRGGGGSSPIIDCVELNIESALLRLSVTNEPAVLVVRVEYGVLRVQGIATSTVREARALRLGMSLRTYNRRLKDARDYIEKSLIKTGDL